MKSYCLICQSVSYFLILQVLFTVLEMKKEHLKKLENNEELDEDDKAVIYYSQPFDLIYSDERSILIDNIMRLNNLEL